MDEEPKKRCRGCKEWVNLAGFYSQPTGKYGVGSKCKACVAGKYATSRPVTPPSEQRCTRCREVKIATLFYPSRTGPTGLQGICIACRLDPERILAIRLTKYSMSTDRFEELLREQGGVCPVCLRVFGSPSEMHVDHDHACCPGYGSCGGCVRGILHGNCNHLIGHALEDCAILAQACEYLTNWRERQ